MDALLLAIWDTIVDREAGELDGPADSLDVFYAAAFSRAIEGEPEEEEEKEVDLASAQVQKIPQPRETVDPAPKTAEPEERPAILQLKITILGSRPPIWRRILVPASFDLEQLHHAIQASMGWRDAQLHEFHAIVGGSLSSARDLAQVFGEEGTQLLYEYGDGPQNWVHTIELERFRDREPGQPYPTCTGGERACPPEDRCDGIAAYDNMLAALADPSHPDHREFAEHITEAFNPNAFNITQAEVNLSRYQV